MRSSGRRPSAMANRIDERLAALAAGRRKGLMTHVVVGYPSLASTSALIVAMDEAGADFIELQIPFSDPLADGPTIQSACEAAIERGARVRDAFTIAAESSARVQAPLLFMAYANTVYRYGTEAFCRDAAAAGISGLIVPDLPAEAARHEGYLDACRRHGLHNIVTLAPTSTVGRNAAQAIAGVQVGLAANSPFLFGKELWRENRIALFEQATDTRPQELKAQGVRPRVWFGERWITSVFDHFEENVKYFPALLPVCDAEDPRAVLDRGDIPRLAELRMHNGTIWRWNRPVYDIHRGKPHLRIENRVLPAGPTIADVMANGAFYFGLLRMLAYEDRPVWSQMSFAAAQENFDEAARRGIAAQLYWPGAGPVPVTELVLRRLLPMAYDGLRAWGVDQEVADRLLGIIERRCITHRNGAEWQADTFHRIDEQSRSADRRDALREMLGRYAELMHSNDPVADWPIG